MENCPINLPDDPYYSLIDKDCCQVVGSCNGLVCLLGYSLTKDDDGLHRLWLRLWNPATRKISNKLGYFRDEMYQLKSWKFAFGYDNSTDTYKVLALHMGHESSDNKTTTTEVQVLSFGNNVWRNIQSFPAVLVMLCFPHTRDYGGVHLNSTVNWLAAINENGNIAVQFVIISFDLGRYRDANTIIAPSRFSGAFCGRCLCVDGFSLFLS
jgi:F-box interacting protein